MSLLRTVSSHRRNAAALAVCLGLAMAISLLIVPAAWAAPVERAATDATTAPHQAVLASSAPVTVFLPLIFKLFPPVYFDDFSNPASGWPSSSSSICNPHTGEQITKAGKQTITYWTRGYNNGEYQFFIPPANATAVWFCQPNAIAPYVLDTDVYTVETVARFQEGTYQGWQLNPWWDNAGLVFGASADNRKLFMICLGTETFTDGSRTQRWTIIANTYYPYKLYNDPDIPYAYPYRGCSEETNRVTPWRGGLYGESPNHLMAVVNGDVVRVYINGDHDPAWVYTLPGLAATTRVGLIGGTYEFTPSDIRFDYFKTTLQY
jgi:hypothetical protein